MVQKGFPYPALSTDLCVVPFGRADYHNRSPTTRRIDGLMPVRSSRSLPVVALGHVCNVAFGK
jgi:hypothetical protein